ncbi:MAG: hypothetical protein IK025_08235 [Bacteroidales bacterium]|nr:hypothetical protein [Bacteroidales bacterium]
MAKDKISIDKKGDTVVLLYTKYEDPGCYVEDNASIAENIQITSDLESVLPIEKKDANHMGEIKKTGEFKVTYTATDEADNPSTRSKIITCKNVSEIYAGKYWTKRNRYDAGMGISSMSRDTAYYSNISAVNNVAGRIRFSKVACHVYNDQKVSFKVDADLFSPELSPRTRSDQVGFLGMASDKEVAFYKGMSYEAAVDSMRYNYVYLDIPTQEASVAYTENEAAINDYKVRIVGNKEGNIPKSKIVYNDRGVLLHIILDLNITIVGTHSPINVVEEYVME